MNLNLNKEKAKLVSDAIVYFLRNPKYLTDHDAGAYAIMDGNYIKLLNWLEETGRNHPIRIHSQNFVEIENMRRIIQKNNWKEVF